MNYTLIDDLSELYNIPKASLSKIKDTIIILLAQYTKEVQKEKESVLEVDIGIGSLYIKIDAEQVEYKFIPNKKTQKSISDCLQANKDPLQIKIEESFKKRIKEIYKELL